jgi:hypothetical protein
LCANANVLHFSGITERIASPSVVIGRDARGDAQRGHRGEFRECDERTAAIVRRANEAHEIDVAKKRSVGAMLAREHDETKSTRAQQFVDGAQRVHAALGPHEQRAVFPERAGDRAGDVDPRGAITVRDRGRTCGAHDGGRAAARLPHGQTSEWKSAAGERAIELCDSRGDRIGGISRDLNGVGKTLFEQDSEGGDLG